MAGSSQASGTALSRECADFGLETKQPPGRRHGTSTTQVAKLYDMPPAEAGDTSEDRTVADNATVRAVFIIVPAVSDEQARAKFPGGWRAPTPYLRIVQQPR
jgi:hypothetical protein